MRYIEKDLNNPIVNNAITRLSKSKSYNSDPIVRDEIRYIYYGCCAYCESTFEDGAFFHIEHFYPKKYKKYKPYSKDIRNLHYSCQRCNTLKGTKNIEILSPNWYLDSGQWKLSTEDKIYREIYYVGHLLFSKNTIVGSTDRGLNTIQLFNLNNSISIPSGRGYLVESRLKLLFAVHQLHRAVLCLLQDYNKTNNLALDVLFEQIIEKYQSTEHFSTMVLQNYGKLTIQLLQIYNSIKVK